MSSEVVKKLYILLDDVDIIKAKLITYLCEKETQIMIDIFDKLDLLKKALENIIKQLEEKS